MRMPIVHNPVYDAEFPLTHRFPMGKYRRLAEVLVEEGVCAAGDFHVPAPAPAAWLKLAHDADYVDRVIESAVPESIEREIGFPVSPKVSLRARTAVGGTVLAARLALAHGLACNTAGGSHHARRAHGAGFCTLNDVGVAASVLLADGEIGRALVFDCDVHQGDGTADIFRDERRVFTLSIHNGRNYPVRKIASDHDCSLPDGVGDQAYLEIAGDLAEKALRWAEPDIVFYNAGVDVHADDRLGRLSLTDAGIAARDRLVLSIFRGKGVPVCGVIGGGYSRDIDVLARRHANLHREAAALFAAERPALPSHQETAAALRETGCSAASHGAL